jgi:Fe-S-cluster containining protein
VESLESERDRARALSVDELADAIESIGFECTRCGACCKAVEGEHGREEHTATVFPDEIRRLQEQGDYDWRDIARPMPYGLDESADEASAGEDGPSAGEDRSGGPTGETFEWALQTDCGDCQFYEETDGEGACTVHGDRPLVCQTYPFSVALGGTSQPLGEAVDREGLVRAHECEGLGRDISRAEAEDLAAALKERAVRELDEAIAVRDNYEPVETDEDVVVHDSEGAKRPDGTPL